jgi:hypothetical protein
MKVGDLVYDIENQVFGIIFEALLNPRLPSFNLYKYLHPVKSVIVHAYAHELEKTEEV